VHPSQLSLSTYHFPFEFLPFLPHPHVRSVQRKKLPRPTAHLTADFGPPSADLRSHPSALLLHPSFAPRARPKRPLSRTRQAEFAQQRRACAACRNPASKRHTARCTCPTTAARRRGVNAPAIRRASTPFTADQRATGRSVRRLAADERECMQIGPEGNCPTAHSREFACISGPFLRHTARCTCPTLGHDPRLIAQVRPNLR